jgi:Fe2+ transport system protein B
MEIPINTIVDEIKLMIDVVNSLLLKYNPKKKKNEEIHNQIEFKLKEIDNAMSELNGEIREQNEKDIQKYKKIYKQYNKEIEVINSTFKSLQSSEQSVKININDLSADQMLAQGRKLQEDDIRRLNGATNDVSQMIEMGTQTAIQLQQNNEQLARIDDQVKEVESNTKIASRYLSSFAKRVATDKIHMGLLLIIVLIIVFMIVFPILRKSGVI